MVKKRKKLICSFLLLLEEANYRSANKKALSPLYKLVTP